LRSGRGGFVARIAAAGRSKPVLAAVLVSQVLRALRRKGVQVERLNDDALAVLLELHAGCAFGREALPAILSALTARGAEEAAPEVARPADQPPGQEVEQPAGQVVGQVVGQGVEQVVKQVVTGGPLRGADVEEMLPRLLGDGRWRRGGNHRKEFLVAMGIVMSELRGRIDGWRVAARVRPYLCGQPAEGLPPGASPARQP
jgi:Glu-tRNA(Gln) amidotransferase subunit E-like FAD-binding protein